MNNVLATSSHYFIDDEGRRRHLVNIFSVQFGQPNLTSHELCIITALSRPAHFEAMPLFLQNPQNFGRSRWKKRYSTPEIYQEMMKKTHRMATEVDAACGKIIDKLREQDVLDNTI